MRALSLIALFTMCAAAYAGTWTGEVVGVVDGDTIKVRRASDGEQVTLSLAEIDAPERHQAYGSAAKAHLSALAFRRSVDVDAQSLDRYGRMVAIVSTGGMDLNRQMLRSGLAWCYRVYARRPSCPSDQAFARSVRAGLWQDEVPIAPWEFRRSNPSRSGGG